MKLSKIIAIIVAAIGVLVSVGWIFDIEIFKIIIPDLTIIKLAILALVLSVFLLWFIISSEESSKAKTKGEAILTRVAHQLRTPLGSMRWNLELVKQEISCLPELAQERLQETYKSNLRVIGLVSDLLNVTRIEQSRINDNPKITDIVEIIRDAMEEMKPEAGKRKIALGVKILKNNIPEINIDPKRFHEVIQNLLSNAVKYTPDGGSVSVEADYAGNSLEITVSDNGIGIPEKDKSKIFTKFMRAENASRIDTEGSGLGLFIVKSFVEKWGGKIHFESEENKGTTFYISLPIAGKKTTGNSLI